MSAHPEKLSAPSFLYLNLTEKCNLRCTHCYGFFGSEKEGELGKDDFQRIIKELSKIGVFYANICGGEPTQSPYFKDVLQFLQEEKLHYMLTTNGLMSNNLLEYIHTYGEYLISVKISLDGFNADTHGVIRKGSVTMSEEAIFRQTVHSISFFQERGYPITVATSLHRQTLEQLPQLLQLMLELKPTAWYLSPITENGRALENRELFGDLNVYRDMLKDVFEIAQENNIIVKLVDIVLDDREYENFSFDCGAALAHCEIHADGTVSPCTLSRLTIHQKYFDFPNIKQNTLKDIWESEPFERFRKYQTMGCSGCKSFTSCNRCVANIFQYYGDPLQIPTFCNSIHEKLGVKPNVPSKIEQGLIQIEIN